MLGNDDARSQDERDSDGGEASSPVSQDHQPPFIEEPGGTGNEEGSKEVAVEDNTVIKIARDFSEKDAEGKIHVEHVESAKEEHGGDNSSSSSSSSSSSDDESHSHRKKWNEEAANTKLTTSLSSSEEKAAATYSDDAPHSFEKPLVEPNGNTVVEAIPPVDTSTPVVPLSQVGERVAESSEVQGAEVLEVVELGVQLNDGKFFPKTDGVTAVSTDAVAQEKNDDKVSPTLEDNNGQSSKAETSPAISGSGSKTLASSDLAAESSVNADTVNDSRTSYDLPGGNKDEELPTSNVQTARSCDAAPKAKDSESHESTTEDQVFILCPFMIVLVTVFLELIS